MVATRLTGPAQPAGNPTLTLMRLKRPGEAEGTGVSEQRPIIIKRKKVAGGDGHHGGAWKVAYADFVTAMMAFFLLMWLLNATSEQQRRGLADYFDPSIPLSRNSGGGSGMLNGEDIMSPPETAMTEEVGDRDPKTRHHSADAPEADPADQVAERSRGIPDPVDEAGDAENDATRRQAPGEKVSDVAAAIAEEQAALDRINRDLQHQFAALGDDTLRRHFSLRMTPEGLVIEIGDLTGQPLFASGDARPRPLLRTLIEIVTPLLALTTNDIAVVGHTDAAPFNRRDGYSNWELSADRANAARRLLADAGLREGRIVRVSGRAETDPLSDDPADARNRRIAITLLRKVAVGG